MVVWCCGGKGPKLFPQPVVAAFYLHHIQTQEDDCVTPVSVRKCWGLCRGRAWQ